MELSKQEYMEKFSLCAMDRDIVALEKIKTSLIKQRIAMDRWFDKYLDMFEKKMNVEETETPIWKLYKDKLKEYDKISHGIKTADYWIAKHVQNS